MLKMGPGAAGGMAGRPGVGSSGSSVGPPPENEEIVSHKRLLELVAQSSAAERLDPDAEELLLDFVDDFVENATVGAARLAKHRKSSTLEPADLLLFLEQAWGLAIPTTATATTAAAATATADSSAAPAGSSVLPAALPSQGPQKVTKHQERLNYVRKLRK